MAKNTKERIMQEALKLFASDGYEAVSVQDIADKIGITKGALYRHYKNKRDIFYSIVDRMEEREMNRAKEYEVPQSTMDEVSELYKNTPFEKMIVFIAAEFEYWTEDEFASNFRKMLAIEQYRDWEMAALYQNYISGEVINYISDYFWGVMRQASSKFNPKLVALELYSPVFILMNMYDVGEDKRETKELLKAHIEAFMNKYQKYVEK